MSRPTGVTPPAVRRGEEARLPGVSPSLAPGLTIFGGVIVAVGAVGTWVRATTFTGGAIPEQVEAVAGRASSSGWILFGLGVACVIAALAWRARVAQLRATPPAVALITIVFASVRLALIDSRAAGMAADAASMGGIDGYHSGFGWGAWLMLTGVVALILALLAGALREIDIRRGG